MAQQLRAVSQNLNGGSQPSITLVPGDLAPSPGLCEHQVHTSYTDIHRQIAHVYIIKINTSSKDRVLHHSFPGMSPVSSALRESPGLHLLHESGQKSSREKSCCSG